MARTKVKDPILDLLDRLTPRVRNAFIRAVSDIKSEAVLARIEREILSKNIEGIVKELHIEGSFFAPVTEELRKAFVEEGQAAVAALSSMLSSRGARIVTRFDANAPRAVQWVATNSSRLITEIAEETRASVRAILEAGLAEGRGPRSVALDIVGRYNAATGARTGGIIGLTSNQTKWVLNAKTQLSSGDPAQLSAYLNRARRDKRFDALVRAAIRGDTKLTAEDIAKIVTRYQDRLLAYRGETIARTELLTALHAGQEEGILQMINGGYLQRSEVVRTWDSSEDAATRPSHRSMDGQRRPMGLPFITGNGYELLYPGDRSLGAPPEETINCRCRLVVSIDKIAGYSE